MELAFAIKRAGFDVLFVMLNPTEHKFIRLINVKMATTIAILTFMSRINTTSETVLKLLKGYTKNGGSLAATTFGEKLHLFFSVDSDDHPYVFLFQISPWNVEYVWYPCSQWLH